MIISIHQPNYIPWAGYFHKIARSDIFVILDDVQFPKGSVANRNTIKGADGKEVVLTVPVFQSKGLLQNYNEIGIDYKSKWNKKHLASFKSFYNRAAFASMYLPALATILEQEYKTLSALNTTVILWILETLDIQTKIALASDIKEDFGSKNDRIVNLCLHFGADTYLSGNGAKKYNNVDTYKANSINLIYSKFEGTQYPQLFGGFIPNLSILDMLFNIGAEQTRERVICPQIIYS